MLPFIISSFEGCTARYWRLLGSNAPNEPFHLAKRFADSKVIHKVLPDQCLLESDLISKPVFELL